LFEPWTGDAQELEDNIVVWLWVIKHYQLVDNATQPHGKILDALCITELGHLILAPQLLCTRHPDVIIADAIHLQFSNIGINHHPQTTRLHLDPHEQCPLIEIGLREVGIVGWTY
jgi:hypothetical protein